MNDNTEIPSPWNTGTPTTPHRVYVVFYEHPDGGYYGLATWTGERWLPCCEENTDAPTAWMWLPDGPTGLGAGQPRKVVIELDPPWPTDADVDEYLKREGLRRGDGEMTCYAGDEDFIEAHAEFGSIGAELAERLDRPGPREVLVVAGATDLRGVPERLALPFGRQYVMVLADDDPIVKMLRNPAPMSMSMSVGVLPSSDGVTPSTEDLYGGPFLGSPVPEPEVRLPADWRDRRPADEDCDGDEP